MDLLVELHRAIDQQSDSLGNVSLYGRKIGQTHVRDQHMLRIAKVMTGEQRTNRGVSPAAQQHNPFRARKAVAACLLLWG